MAFAQVNSDYYTKAGYDSSKHEAIKSICLHMIVCISDLPMHQAYVPN